MLDLLANKTWPNPNVKRLPDEYQTSQRTRLLALAEAVAEEEPLRRNDFNFLDDGVWELKINDLRVSFFDVDGEGGWVPKNGEKVPAWDGDRYELPDDFDKLIRVGHYFAKTGKRTAKTDIFRSIEVRKEDVAHDTRAA